jgi:arylsulfatase A-like enzyme
LGFKSPHGPRGGRNLPERVRELYVTAESRPAPNLEARPPFQAERPGRGRGSRAQDARRVEGHRNYMRHITAIDHCVGRVLDALEETGRTGDTIVVVTSDNGYYLGEHGLSDKRSAYEESIRVPLLIRAPGGPAGVSDALALNVDLGPTLLDYAGVAPLDGAHGQSLRPALAGGTPAEWRTAFLYEYFRERNFASPTVLAVRTATHKLITYPGHDDWTELYDVASDPYETKNMASDAALVGELERELEAQKAAVDFQMPEEPPAGRRIKRRGRPVR